MIGQNGLKIFLKQTQTKMKIRFIEINIIYLYSDGEYNK